MIVETIFHQSRGFRSLRSPWNRLFHGTGFASSDKKSTTSRDTRLAGRLRFYKEVGVQQASAPWEMNTSKDTEAVDSPISAGVDGTDSASGVHHPQQDKESTSTFESMLSPRSPGSTKLAENVKWFGVTLDGRTLKTPMGKPLALPSEKLAYMIAAEWDAQKKYLQPANMPLMTLACTALDQASYQPEFYRQESLRFLPTDTTCFWADATEDRVLYRRQEEAWTGLHEFVSKKFDQSPTRAMGANEAMVMSRKRGDAKPFVGLPHPRELVDKASDWTHSLDAWNLVALSSICAQAKSFLVAFAILEPESPLHDIPKAIEASRVEEEFQISNWGLVEGGHDYDRLNCSIQLQAAKLFSRSIAIDNKLEP